MRLIDKDEILNLIGAIVSKFPEEYDEKTYKMIRRVIRDKRQEVKTIPIEWIKEHYGWLTMAGEIIKDWEKEHEAN